MNRIPNIARLAMRTNMTMSRQFIIPTTVNTNICRPIIGMSCAVQMRNMSQNGSDGNNTSDEKKLLASMGYPIIIGSVCGLIFAFFAK